MNFPPDLLSRAEAVVRSYRHAGRRLVTAESCTGGLVAGLLTEIAGSSDVLDRGFVTYSNGSKSELLGVPASLIAMQGAVSQEVARAMATGALRAARNADVAVAITGIAGPGGGSDLKPVGLVHLACARRDGAVNSVERRYGDLGRSQVREAALRDALRLLAEALPQT